MPGFHLVQVLEIRSNLILQIREPLGAVLRKCPKKPLKRLELLVRLYTFLWPTKQLQVTGKKTLTFKWWFQYVSMSWSSAQELWNKYSFKNPATFCGGNAVDSQFKKVREIIGQWPLFLHRILLIKAFVGRVPFVHIFPRFAVRRFHCWGRHRGESFVEGRDGHPWSQTRLADETSSHVIVLVPLSDQCDEVDHRFDILRNKTAMFSMSFCDFCCLCQNLHPMWKHHILKWDS